MNKATAKCYEKGGGYSLVGKSLMGCHSPKSQELINKVISWFSESPDNNIIFESRKLTIDTVTSQMLMEFLDDMVRDRNWSPQTRNERLSMIRSFYQYAAADTEMKRKLMERASKEMFPEKLHTL